MKPRKALNNSILVWTIIIFFFAVVTIVLTTFEQRIKDDPSFLQNKSRNAESFNTGPSGRLAVIVPVASVLVH